MLGRDKITVHFHDRTTGTEFTRVCMGRVVTEQLAGEAVEPMTGRPVFGNFYRVLLPRHLDLSGGTIVGIDFDREGARSRFEVGLTPIYDGRGRIHHYEGVTRSS